MTIVAMEGMASEACDRERMYLDVGSRDLMSKSPFLPVKPNVKRRKHTSPTTTSVSRRRQLSCVSLCPSAPPLLAHSRHPMRHTRRTRHSKQHTTSTSPVRRRTHRSLSQTLISNLSLLAPISLSKRKYRIISQQTTLTPRIIEQTLLSLLRPHSKLTRRRTRYYVSRGPPYRHGDAVASSASPYAAASQRSRV